MPKLHANSVETSNPGAITLSRLVELLTTYLAELPGRVAAIEHGAAARDPEALARAAHGLVSPSSPG